MSEVIFKRYQVWIWVIILSAMQVANAQNGANPFDLQHKLPKEKQQTENQENTSGNPFDINSSQPTTPATEVEQESDSPVQNPFDIQKTEAAKTKESAKPKKTIVQKPLKNIEKPQDTRSGFLFWSILGMMIFFALLVTLYRSLIGKVYRAFTNDNLLKLLQREQGAFISIPYIFLYILFFISMGIFLFQIAYYYEKISFEFKNMAYCILGLMLFFLLKHLLLKIIDFVFPISKEVRQYNFTIIVFSIILGIILLPFNVFIAFAQDTLTFSGIIGALVSITLIYLFRAMRGLFIGSKFFAFHKFHFFMYICTVEIAPVIILIKILLNGANIH